MAKQLVVTHAGIDIAFGLTKIERHKLYGARRRIAIDAQDLALDALEQALYDRAVDGPLVHPAGRPINTS